MSAFHPDKIDFADNIEAGDDEAAIAAIREMKAN
jgi:hypothetical protein